MTSFGSAIGGAQSIEQAVRAQAPATLQQSPTSAGYNPAVMPPQIPTQSPQANPVGAFTTPPQSSIPQTQNEESMLILKALTDRLKSNTKSMESQAQNPVI